MALSMSTTHDIDDHLFHFDCEEPAVTSVISGANSSLSDGASTSGHPKPMSSCDDLLTSEELGENEVFMFDSGRKGKGVARSAPIRIPIPAVHDAFDMAGESSSVVPATSQGSHPPLQPLTPFGHSSIFCSTEVLASSSIQHAHRDVIPYPYTESFLESGKEKPPPVLPPLSFSPTEFGYGQVSWPSPATISQTPGPSSYDSNFGLSAACNNTNTNSTNIDNIASNSQSPVPQTVDTSMHTNHFPLLERMPSRRRSLSNLSVHSTRSLAARSMSRIKLKFGPPYAPSNLARNLLFRKSPQYTEVHSSAAASSGAEGAKYTSDMTIWYTPFKVNELDSGTSQFSSPHLQGTTSKVPDVFNHGVTTLKHKGRSNSLPFRLSALDYVPMSSTDIFTPIPLVIKNYFDEVLPQELRIRILASLIDLHEMNYIRADREGRWSVSKATSAKGRWVGRDKGIRELVKLSRVSKTWQTLVFDGQLWVDINLRAFPQLPESVFLRLTATGGPFTASLDLAGHVHLTSPTFINVIDKLCLSSAAPLGGTLANTQLTAINLQGCSGLTSLSLHYLLVRCRSLQKLWLKGLQAVTNTTCDIISTYCPQLVSLNLSRCYNMDAEGIRHLASAATGRGEHLMLKELYLSGLKNINDPMMAALGRATPHLEVLDLSYTRQLHNSALEAFVACDNAENIEGLGVETVFVSSRDVGRQSNDLEKFQRRVTRLRHLSISFCILLTDNACSNLAHSVPRLEFLELAGIGADLRDEGLIRLLNSTPFIRRLDLEDASHISDSVIAAITPNIVSSSEPSSNMAPVVEPGHALEHLSISHATLISDDALLALVRGCTRLKSLEADNTRIGSSVIREFIRLCKQRKMTGARIVAIDCRGISEPFVKEMSASTRPRKGLRAYEARKLMYLDGRDGNADELKIGQDECDDERVVLKSFYSWQTVDAVKALREKKRKSTSRRIVKEMGRSSDDNASTHTRWWTPGGRRSPGSGRSSPLNMADLSSDGCIIM